MMQAARGLGLTFAAFAAAFALHVVGGATGQGWLFAIAVGLIYLTAMGFPAIALWVSGLKYRDGRESEVVYRGGVLVGMGLTLGALWATNDRSFGTWVFLATPLLVAVVSALVLMVRAFVEGELPRRPSATF
jgi:hypothetical protein